LNQENGKPGPQKALHRLLPQEREQVLELARRQEYADLSHRILTVTGWDQGLFFVSFSTVYRILRAENLTVLRGVHRLHNGSSVPPVRKELTGPNQRWSWDISYLRTYEKGIFVYLYLLLDEYSRKAIQWVVSWTQSQQEARQLLEGGLMEENILDLPEEARPEVFNDRGRQMKAKSIRRLLEDHQMPQVFIRPRTPNDNAFVESAFSTAKRAPAYPGRFLDQEEAVAYFSRYFRWYNREHYHSGIDYVTPEQAHQGLRGKIVAERRRRLEEQRQRRKEVNRATAAISITESPGLQNALKSPCQGAPEVWAESRSAIVWDSCEPVFGQQIPTVAGMRISAQNHADETGTDNNLSDPSCSVITS
jgi:transposase InsO family protein